MERDKGYIEYFRGLAKNMREGGPLGFTETFFDGAADVLESVIAELDEALDVIEELTKEQG